MVSKHKQEIISYYDTWWENPSDIRNVIFNRLTDLLIERIPDGDGKTALDIGLGRGKISSLLISRGYEVTIILLNKKERQTYTFVPSRISAVKALSLLISSQVERQNRVSGSSCISSQAGRDSTAKRNSSILFAAS